MQEFLDELNRLKRRGEYQEALTRLMDYFRVKDHPAVLAEAIRVSLLLNKKEQALKLFFVLVKNSGWQEHIDSNILLRLKLCFPNDETIRRCKLDVTKGGEWLQVYLEEKIDKPFPANIKSWNLTCGDGRTTYDLTLECLSCRQQHFASLQMFFLIRRTYLCPFCLSRQHLDYEILKTYFESNEFKQQLANDVEGYNDWFRKTRMELNTDFFTAQKYPELCQYLNIDYMFIINQLLITRLNFNPQSGE
jgi:hypothetical protein